jgi:hypothetical protein
MLYGEIIAVCSENHTKHINAFCEQNAEFMDVIPGSTQNNHWDLQGYLNSSKYSSV